MASLTFCFASPGARLYIAQPATVCRSPQHSLLSPLATDLHDATTSLKSLADSLAHPCGPALQHSILAPSTPLPQLCPPGRPHRFPGDFAFHSWLPFPLSTSQNPLHLSWPSSNVIACIKGSLTFLDVDASVLLGFPPRISLFGHVGRQAFHAVGNS